MRIGFEVSNVTTDRPSGISRYIREVITALARITNDELTLWYKISRLKRRRHWWRPQGIELRTWQGRWWPPKKSMDIIHGMDAAVPDWLGIKKIATVHDLLAVMADDEVARESFRRKKLAAYRELLSRADALIAVSSNTRNDLIDTFGVSEEKISVVHLGIDPRFSPRSEEEIEAVRARYELPQDYLLFTGEIAGRKNTERLVRAFARSREARDRVLILAGSLSYRGERTLQAIADCGLGDRVRPIGFVTDEYLPALYSGTAAFLFPTLYEGFGIPILEAMACGVPVLIGDRGAAREVAGGHAIPVDPYSIDAIADGIDRVLAMHTAMLADALDYARGFTWERCARGTLSVYRRIIEP